MTARRIVPYLAPLSHLARDARSLVHSAALVEACRMATDMDSGWTDERERAIVFDALVAMRWSA